MERRKRIISRFHSLSLWVINFRVLNRRVTTTRLPRVLRDDQCDYCEDCEGQYDVAGDVPALRRLLHLRVAVEAHGADYESPVVTC